jgi:hypothetical protein
LWHTGVCRRYSGSFSQTQPVSSQTRHFAPGVTHDPSSAENISFTSARP